MSAWIAWETLSPTARQRATDVLALHPDFPHWRAAQNDDRAAPDAETSGPQMAFVNASLWADRIREAPEFLAADQGLVSPGSRNPGFPDLYTHREWHFVNQPLGASEQVVLRGQLHRMLPKLADTLADRKGPYRAYALVWLIHLLADLHQPLHVATRRTGIGHDAGGNAVKLLSPTPGLTESVKQRSPVNLHAFWDALPAPDWLSDAALVVRGRALMETNPAPAKTAVNFSAWRRETFELAAAAYAPATSMHPGKPLVLKRDYILQSRVVAERQIALAGYRLAGLIEQTLTEPVVSGTSELSQGKHRVYPR